MAFPTFNPIDRTRIPFKSKNKEKRHAQYVKVKKSKESARRDERMRRKREEDKNPHLRAQRHAKHVPITIESKRTWDEVAAEEGDGLGLSVDVERLKRPRIEEAVQASADPESQDSGLIASKLRMVDAQPIAGDLALEGPAGNHFTDGDDKGTDEDAEDDAVTMTDSDDELASILDDSEDESAQDEDRKQTQPALRSQSRRASSPAASTTSTNLSVIPDVLAAKFPTLFQTPPEPKILITTALGGTVHREAEILTTFLPNSQYVPRQRHKYRAHHFSLREIAKFASNRDFTTLVVLEEVQKKPSGLVVIHLPAGPTFHFSVKNWVEGKKLPGHGNPTDHHPELILNNFRTPLGLLTAHLFRTMFPPQPELDGRQVVTLHNQRDYIFVRRHRYIFREKRATEKKVVGSDGKPMKGVESIKAGLQEIGPRFTLKLRRIDKGVQRASGQEWQWKSSLEKERTKFQL